jgi:hypothetical protein
MSRSTTKVPAPTRGKAKSKAKNGDGAPKKPGNPGKFKGEQLKFLENQRPIYLGQQGRGKVTDFFAKMWPLWWEAFPWYTAVQGVAPGTALATGAAASDDNVSAAALESGGASVNSSAGVDASATVDGNIDASRSGSAGASDGKGPAAAVSTDGAASADNGETSAGGEALVVVVLDVGEWPATGGVDPMLEATVKAQTIAVGASARWRTETN